MEVGVLLPILLKERISDSFNSRLIYSIRTRHVDKVFVNLFPFVGSFSRSVNFTFSSPTLRKQTKSLAYRHVDMTHFQVFLPPPSLPSLSSFKDASVISTEQLLTFHRLNPPPREESHSLPPPNDDPSNNPPEAMDVHYTDQTEATGHGKVSVLGKRAVSSRAIGSQSDQNEDIEISTFEERSRNRMPPPPSLPTTNHPAVRTSPRRASKKLVTRPSFILPSSTKRSTTLPDQGQEQSLGLESTLNTTASSWPSQIPPSAGAETSIFNFPSWSVPTSRLTSLQDVLKKGSAPQQGGLVFDNGYGGKERYNIIACIASVDTPLERQRKTQLGMRGRTKGRQDASDTLWIGKWMITAPPDGNEGQVSCVVRLWDECAKDWGDEKVRKGDVVLLESTFWTGPSEDVVNSADDCRRCRTQISFGKRISPSSSHTFLSPKNNHSLSYSAPVYHYYGVRLHLSSSRCSSATSLGW